MCNELLMGFPRTQFYSLSHNQLTNRNSRQRRKSFFRTKNTPKNEVSMQLVTEDNKTSVKICFILRPVHL